MQFFKRILQPTTSEVAPEKRRGGQRLAVSLDLPLRTGLCFPARPATGRDAWNWKGRIVDCSEQGVRLQFEGQVAATSGESCDLKLDLEEFVLVVPCHVSNVRRQGDVTTIGLRHDVTDEDTMKAYHQFLEIVALGATLRPHLRRSLPPGSNYLVEQYVSERRSCLNVWRHPADGAVAAIEFLLKDCLVRIVAGHAVEYYAGTEAVATQRAAGAPALEIHRLFRWVLPNLSHTVPADVREFLVQNAR